MEFKLEGDGGDLLDARVEIGDESIALHGRGGAKGKNPLNPDYSEALRFILQRLSAAELPIEGIWVDSSQARRLPDDERSIWRAGDSFTRPDELIRRLGARMKDVGRAASSKGGNSTKRILIRLGGRAPATELQKVFRAQAVAGGEVTERLAADRLHEVTAENLWHAVERLRGGESHSFGPSLDYDVVLEDGTRLAPKAVFGLAASEALGFEVLPGHFTAGETSPSFRILRAAGYTISTKNDEARSAKGPPGALAAAADAEWREGTPRIRRHLGRERAAGLGEAKKARFRRENGGRLFCEACGFDPVAQYGTQDAEACIEAHHDAVQIKDMAPGHRTRLEDLKCLCANCHRLEHRRLRRTAGDAAELE
jgi:hypothetical protein